MSIPLTDLNELLPGVMEIYNRTVLIQKATLKHLGIEEII
jgi:hypothetical protein